MIGLLYISQKAVIKSLIIKFNVNWTLMLLAKAVSYISIITHQWKSLMRNAL